MINVFDVSYVCTGQMSFDECLAEMERYKWDSGQYMNLPEIAEDETERKEGGMNGRKVR